MLLIHAIASDHDYQLAINLMLANYIAIVSQSLVVWKLRNFPTVNNYIQLQGYEIEKLHMMAGSLP